MVAQAVNKRLWKTIALNILPHGPDGVESSMIGHIKLPAYAVLAAVDARRANTPWYGDGPLHPAARSYWEQAGYL
jgi:hypothetical protein